MTPEQVMKELQEVLRPGNVVNFDSKPKWYQFWLKIVFAEIRRCQRKKFGKNSRWRDIHSVLVLGYYSFRIPGTHGFPKVLSATVPKVVIEPLSISKRTRKVTVCRLHGAEDGFSDEWLKTMREAASELVGRGYDPLDLLAIKLKLQKWPKWITKWIDLGKKRVVCSGAVQYCLDKAWEEHGKWNKTKEIRLTVPSEPLNGLAPNEVYPAHFVNHRETFKIIKEWRL